MTGYREYLIFFDTKYGFKSYLCILLDAFVTTGAWEGPITDQRTSARRYKIEHAITREWI